MITPTTQELVLLRYPMLRELPAQALADLMATAMHVKVPAGAMMFDENQVCMGFPLLLAGSARIIKAAPNGRELHLYDVQPGEACILTSSCLLGRANYQARGLARDDLELVVLPPATFKALFSQVEAFREYVFSRFSERMHEMLQLVAAVTFQKLDQRLAASLAAKASPVRSTHQALADELGSVRELVSRLLKNFSDQGWVRLGREQIEIIDVEALRRIAIA